MKKFLLAAGALVAVPVFAQVPVPGVTPVPTVQPPRPGMTMGGKLATRAEVIARTQQRFAMLDTNRDSILDQAELASVGRGRGARGPGRLAGSMPRDRNAVFDRIDSNRDGSLSRDEFARAPNTRGGAMGGGGRARLWTMADTNRDGRVTLPEATGAALERFDRLDANRDGQLTPDERASAPARWRQMRGG